MAETIPNKFAAETRVAERMSQITGDANWAGGDGMVKTLTLEHHMAARRFGFQELFNALYPVERLRTGFLEGSLAGMTFFTRYVLPVAKAMEAGDRFHVAATVRRNSPLFDHTRMEAAGEKQVELIRAVKGAVDELYAICSRPGGQTLLEVLRNVSKSGLFAIPESLVPFASADEQGFTDDSATEEVEDAKSEIVAWRRALETPFEQVERYEHYVRGMSSFDTHQGVKGLEFPRVMVVISDEEARGFLFSYEKLFGAKDKSKTDKENEAAGKETTIERTRRLFYVTCSRALKSLAIVYYSNDPAEVKRVVIERGWFNEEEVELLT